MKRIVAELVANALAGLPELAEAAGDLAIESTVERTRDPSHGDFASNVAMRLAKPARRNPREIAQQIIDARGLGDRVKVLFLQEAIDSRHPAAAGLASTADSEPGASEPRPSQTPTPGS